MRCFPALLAAQLFRVSLADLPVHCLRHQVAGHWEFTLGPLSDRRQSCGHKRPDSQYKQPTASFLASLGPAVTRSFTLDELDTANAEDGSTGTWTMIYDEGFEVAVGDMVYFAFSKFELVDDGKGGSGNVSHCDQTEVGWYHDSSRSQWGCYIGKKVEAGEASATPVPATAMLSVDRDSDGEGQIQSQVQADGQDDSQTKNDADAKSEAGAATDSSSSSSSNSGKNFWQSWSDQMAKMAAQPLELSQQENVQQQDATTDQSQVQTDPAADPMQGPPPPDGPIEVPIAASEGSTSDSSAQWIPASAGYDRPMASQWQSSVADGLNLLQLGWTAAPYDMFAGKTPRELNRLAGVRRHRPQKQQQRQPSTTRPSSFLAIRSRTRQASAADQQALHARTFSWRDKDGADWLQPVVTQGDCGSCYTISTIHMLTARNRIRKNDRSEPEFSVSFPLYCSEYNQGCDGGYGFLLSKWSEDVGLVPEACAPFSQGGGSCQVQSGCQLGSRRYRAANHHYVGGFYGGSDEEAIKRELVNGGPLVMSFEPKEDFMYYKSGIYRSGPNKIHQEWEQVDHAVLLVGYGVDGNQPNWMMQNSWGDDWGEDGFFRMARGIDESGCESIVVSADVVEDSGNPVLDDFLASM